MAFFILLLIVGVIWLISAITSLKERVERLDLMLVETADQIRLLTRDLQRLEHTTPPLTAAEKPAPAPAPAPPMAPPAREAVPPPIVSRPAVITPVPVVQTPVAPTPPVAPVPPVAPAQPVATAPVVVTAPPPSIPAPGREPLSIAAATATEPAESWEMVVGTSWLNKIGVFVFVIGVALLVGYSFTRIGPAGRVAIGYALSLGMLGTGVFLERRPMFRNYAYGLVAGGWAGVYFTTFAMHDVPAAKVIESDLVAVSLLSAVAGVMIVHSLRYRSQVVTSLAFIVAYATLALSPLSGFSLAASAPLAVSVLVVSQRLAWPAISALGIIATYGVFVLRGAVFPGGIMDPDSAVPYLTLGAYWLTFEAAELIGLHLRRRANEPMTPTGSVSMLALNAVGLMGTTLVVLPDDRPELLSSFLFAAGTAYLGSAAIRAWLVPERRQFATPDRPFDSTHAATAMASALFMFAIGLRFSNSRESLALLLEAQLLFVAGLTIGDAWLRRFASIVAAAATVHACAIAIAIDRTAALASPGVATPIAVLGLIAMIWYANREALAQRRVTPSWVEPAYSWAATALLAVAVFFELAPTHEALAGLLLATVLLECGARRGVEYVLQAYLVGLAGAYAMIAAFLTSANANGWLDVWGPAPASLDQWTVLPAGIFLTAYVALRLVTREESERTPWRIEAAGVSAAFATALVLIFEWRALAPDAVAPAWALTAAGLVAVGAWRQLAALRWQGYAVVMFAAVRAVPPLIEAAPHSTAQTVSVIVVIAAMYVAGYLGRRGMPAQDPTMRTSNDAEAGATAILSLAATASFVLWKYRVLPEVLVAPAWAATAIVLAVLGSIRRSTSQRWQGSALAVVAALHVNESLLAQPTANATESLWAAVVAALVYTSAWLAHRAAARRLDPEAVEHALLAVGTAVVAILLSRVFDSLHLGPAWVASGVVILGLGLWRRIVDLRWHGLALLALGTLRAGRPVFSEPDATTQAITWLGMCIGALYACSLATKQAFRSAQAAGETRAGEDIAGDILSLGATGFLAMLILQEVRSSMVTLALGLQGLGLMVTGLVARQRVMRLSGLGLLLGCILKLFVLDLRELEALARIFSFVALGLFLLGISWAYTRYREHLSKLL